jgi:hypothetical protein
LKNDQYQSQMQLYYLRLVPWIVRMNSDLLKDNSMMTLNKEFLKMRSYLILEGVKLAIEMKRTVKNLLLMH